MGQRLLDYAIVAAVVLAVFGLFRLSRVLLKQFLFRLESKIGKLGPDRTLFVSFIFLLSGLLFLPSATALLALMDSRHLVGGMPLHLSLVALSIILFSMSEDMLREFPSMKGDSNLWSVSEHFKRLSIPLLLFWALGILFLSPIFYSALTIILSLFYLYALSCRHAYETDGSGKSD